MLVEIGWLLIDVGEPSSPVGGSVLWAGGYRLCKKARWSQACEWASLHAVPLQGFYFQFLPWLPSMKNINLEMYTKPTFPAPRLLLVIVFVLTLEMTLDRYFSFLIGIEVMWLRSWGRNVIRHELDQGCLITALVTKGAQCVLCWLYQQSQRTLSIWWKLSFFSLAKRTLTLDSVPEMGWDSKFSKMLMLWSVTSDNWCKPGEYKYYPLRSWCISGPIFLRGSRIIVNL